MNTDALFCTISSKDIAQLIRNAQHSVCYAAPGISMEVAEAMVNTSKRLGAEMLTVCLDFNENVMRMGYGEIKAVGLLGNTKIRVSNVSGLRTAIIISDENGFIFTPTPLYLEAEPASGTSPNAVRMSTEQIAEALARLSHAAKAIALAQAKTPEDKLKIKNLPVDIASEEVDARSFDQVSISLEKAPPVRFDLARQVRVFVSYLQYVELSLTGAAIQRQRLAIPKSIQKLGESEDLKVQLHTTFDLLENDSKLSSKTLNDELNNIRNVFTHSLGDDSGRVALKSAMPLLSQRLSEFRVKLVCHQAKVKAELQPYLDKSRQQIIDYFVPRVMKTPPDALLAQLLSGEDVSEEDAVQWLDEELDVVFPDAESLVKEMKLEERYKDITFNTLNNKYFLESVKTKFKHVDWDKAYEEFKAAGESQHEQISR